MRRLQFLIPAFCFPLWCGAGTITGAEIEPSGESMAIYVSGYNTNGVLDFGFTTNANSGCKVRATFTVPGVNNFTENFLGTKAYSFAYPYQSNYWIEPYGAAPPPLNDGVRIRVALSKRVTISDTAGLLDVDANWFSNNTAVVGMTITNNSLLTYGSLRPIAMWRSMPWQLWGSNTLIKLVAREYFASSNVPVHSVDMWANSGAINTVTQTITQPTIDWNARDPVPVQEYMVWHNYGVFNQGSTITNHFTIKLRRGTNVFSTITSPYPPDHPDYAPLVGFCDKSNTWPYVVALVDATNGSTAGVAVTNWSTATNGSTAAFATIAQAKHAAGLTNQAVHGTNTYSNCYIVFANTNAQQYGWMGGETPGTRGASTTWTHYQPAWGVNKTNVRLSFITGSTVGQKTIKDHINGVYIDFTANATMFGNGNAHVWIDDCLIGTNTGSSAGLTAFTTNTWVTKCTLLRFRGALATLFNSQQYSSIRMWGNTALGFPENTTCIWSPSLFVGNSIRPIGTQQQFILKNDVATVANLGLADPCYWSFNEILNQDNTAGGITTIAIGLTTNLSVGAVVDNNLLEGRNYGTQPQFDIMQSQRDGEGCTNYMSSGMTSLMVYHPIFELATNSTLSGWHDRNGIFASLAFRGDVSALNPAATNRWGRYFSVDCSGNVQTLIGAEIPPDMTFYSAAVTRNNGFNGVSALVLSNLPALQNNLLGFVDNRSAYGGTTNGFGNYLLRPNGLTYGGTNMVKVDNMYTADLRGVVRPKNNPNSNKRPDTPGVYSQSRLR